MDSSGNLQFTDLLPTFYEDGASPSPSFQQTVLDYTVAGAIDFDCGGAECKRLLTLPVLGPSMQPSTFTVSPFRGDFTVADSPRPVDFFAIQLDATGVASAYSVGCSVDGNQCGPEFGGGFMNRDTDAYSYVLLGTLADTTEVYWQANYNPAAGNRWIGLLERTSVDPATWAYQDEPGNDDARFLFTLEEITSIQWVIDGPPQHGSHSNFDALLIPYKRRPVVPPAPFMCVL